MVKVGKLECGMIQIEVRHRGDVVLQRQDGSSCVVDRIDFERGFEALNEKLME